MSQADVQRASYGISTDAITDAALEAVGAGPGLSWLDIGCGVGDAVRKIKERSAPARLVALDVVDFLEPDLRDGVEYLVGPAEELLPIDPVDCVLAVEVLEHVEAPWTVLRQAARCVAPGGALVMTTPNLQTFKHRVLMVAKGDLMSFRASHPPHLSPILPHVAQRILEDEGLVAEPPFFAGPEHIPYTGRTWPESQRRRFPRLMSLTVGLVARRPVTPG